jgi:hypothetical protein
VTLKVARCERNGTDVHLTDILKKGEQRMREKIELDGTNVDMAVKMSEGNPGALSVLIQLMEMGMDGFMVIMHLDDMNIRGSQIWVGYKDFCGEDIEKFKETVEARSPEMVEVINQMPSGALGTEEKAVTNGGSYRHEKSSKHRMD